MTTFQRRRLVVGLVAFLLLALVALLVAVPRIQDDRTAYVERQLRAAGLTGIEVTFAGRDGTLTGPASQEEAALAAVDEREGIRSLTYQTPDAGQGTGSSTTTTAAGATTTVPGATSVPPAAALGAVATVAGTGVTLAGAVPTDADKQALAATALAAFGPGNVNDQVQVAGGAWEPAAVGAFAGLRTYLDAAGARLRAGEARASGATLAATGTGFAPQATAALNQALATIGTGGVTVSASVTDAAPATDAATLQTPLDELVGRAGINFAAGSAAISAPSRAVLDTAAETILAGPASTRIEVGGHTDNVGTAANNDRLSLLRAQAVRQYLIGKGVPAVRLTAKGYGSAEPVADNATPEGRARNRRIEFTVSGS